jgi:hypothetical protein
MRTASPHPLSTHQPPRDAWLKPPLKKPPVVVLASAPTTATPSVEPICREVEAIAEATPAWALGIPDTAAEVMGVFTKPKPMPKIT